MEIGTLIKSKMPDATVKFYGSIQTIKHTIMDFELVKNPRKSEEKSSQPDYLIHYPSRDAKILIGAGWHREFIRDGIAGEMISLTFDDPSFDSSLHVTAFKGDDEYRWPITWRRQRASA